MSFTNGETKMELRHFFLVAAVDKHGSLTSAARHLCVTQSALSHQLRGLEEDIGAECFYRQGRKMILTAVGRRVLRSANVILNEVEQAEHDLKELVDGRAGEVRISTECYTAYHWLPKMMKSYAVEHPDIDVEIVAEATRCPVDYLVEGKLDVAITGSAQRHRDDSHLKHEWLFEDELLVVTAPDHRFAGRRYVNAKDFADENILTYTLSPEEIGFFGRILLPGNVTPKKITRIELTEGIVAMVKAGIGVAVMAEWAIAPLLKAKSIVATRITRSGYRRHWFATTLPAKSRPAYLESFVDHLKSGVAAAD